MKQEEANKFIKCARIARTTGKSLRASPAFYEWRWALNKRGTHERNSKVHHRAVSEVP
jgi:hypothetical protein